MGMEMNIKTQSLKQALRLIRSGRGLCDVTRSGLAGCPVGGWAETAQARSRMIDALPVRSARAYSVDDIITALYAEDSAGRWQYRQH